MFKTKKKLLASPERASTATTADAPKPAELKGLREIEKLALLAYKLYGEGPVDFRELRYLFVVSPCFNVEGDWFVKSIGYVILSTDVLVERGGKYYVNKKYVEKFKNVDIDVSICLPKERRD